MPIPASLRERGHTCGQAVDSAPIPTTRRPSTLTTRSSTRSSNCSAETSPAPPRHRPTPRPHHRIRRCVQDQLQRLGGRSLLAGDFYILNRLKAGPSIGSAGLNLKAIWKQHRAQRQKAERQDVMRRNVIGRRARSRRPWRRRKPRGGSRGPRRSRQARRRARRGRGAAGAGAERVNNTVYTER